MLDLAKHIVNQKAGTFNPEKFEGHYESALVELINEKRAGKVIRPKERPKGENVADLMEALRRSVGREVSAEPKSTSKKLAKRPRKAMAGQKEILMPITGKKQAKEAKAKRPAAAKSQRRSA
jgi:DNA end-binding protein Ku